MKLTVQARFEDDHWKYIADDALGQSHYTGAVYGLASFDPRGVEMLIRNDIRHQRDNATTADPITFEIEVP